MILISYKVRKNLGNYLMKSAWGNHLVSKGWGVSLWESISNHVKGFLVWNRSGPWPVWPSVPGPAPWSPDRCPVLQQSQSLASSDIPPEHAWEVPTTASLAKLCGTNIVLLPWEPSETTLSLEMFPLVLGKSSRGSHQHFWDQYLYTIVFLSILWHPEHQRQS